MSRSRHSESDKAVTTAITVEAQASLLSGGLEVEKCPEKSVQLPYPSHPGQGGESEISQITRSVAARDVSCRVDEGSAETTSNRIGSGWI